MADAGHSTRCDNHSRTTTPCRCKMFPGTFPRSEVPFEPPSTMAPYAVQRQSFRMYQAGSSMRVRIRGWNRALVLRARAVRNGLIVHKLFQASAILCWTGPILSLHNRNPKKVILACGRRVFAPIRIPYPEKLLHKQSVSSLSARPTQATSCDTCCGHHRRFW